MKKLKCLKDVFVLLIAQELVSDWLGTKLQEELASDGEEDAENTVSNVIPRPEASSHWRYDRFDGKTLPDCSKLYHLIDESNIFKMILNNK